MWSTFSFEKFLPNLLHPLLPGQAAVEPNQDPEMPMEEGVNIQYPAIEDVAIRGDLRDEVLRSDREISDPGESSDVELNEPGEPPQDFGRGDAPDQLVSFMLLGNLTFNLISSQ